MRSASSLPSSNGLSGTVGPVLAELAYPGLHEQVIGIVPRPFGNGKAIDLGAGTGAFAERLAGLGWNAEAADVSPGPYLASIPFRQLDLNDEYAGLDASAYQLIVAIEVIEHLENPIALLRTIAFALALDGLAIVTTPNVESITARAKFAIKGKLQAMVEWGDPNHITPVFLSLLPRYLERSGLTLKYRNRFPQRGDVVGGRTAYRPVARFLDRIDPTGGDCHILVLGRDQ